MRNTWFGLEAGFVSAERLAYNTVCCEELAFRASVPLEGGAGNRFREEK
jgi:hypothetical protein